MDITFGCQKCGQQMIIDEAGAGQRVNCPRCGTSLEVPYESQRPVLSPPPNIPVPPVPSSPVALRPESNTRRCPFCAEEIKNTAIQCKHCGSMLSVPRSQAHPNVMKRHSLPTNRTSIQSPYVIAGSMLVVALVLSLGFFHIVRLNDTPFFDVVPKEHFTYSLSIVSLDYVIQCYNQRPIAVGLHGEPLLDNLVEGLERHGYISKKKPTWRELEDKVRQALPSE